jgi:hypothetical protein
VSWSDTATEVINRIYQQQVKSGETDKARIAKAIDEAYPFGERAMWPYKAWLAARRKYFSRAGLPLRDTRNPATKVGWKQGGLFS